MGETLRAALNELATVAPDWLRAHVPVEWYERYARRIENYHLPKSDTAREDYAAQVGQDGQALLGWLDDPTTNPKLPQLARVQTLRQIWAEQFTTTTQGLRLRPVKEMPAVAELLASPYDVDARWSTKRGLEWVGYKVHLTETCEGDQPHLITEVTTTPATTPDDNMLAPIQAKLAARDLLPAEHLVDKGYTSAEVLVTAQAEYGVKIVGPVATDPSWQARTADRLCQSAVPSRLGAPSRDLPGRKRESFLVEEQLSRQWHRVGSPFCQSRLHAVSEPGAMYPGQGRTADHWVTGTPAAGSLAGTAGGTTHAGVPGRVCGARGH